MVARIVTLLLALLVAAAGAGLVIFYARQADRRAQQQNDPVEVLVAISDIPPGTDFQTALAIPLVERATRPVGSLAATALRVDATEQGGQVVVSAISPAVQPQWVTLQTVYAGEEILSQQFQDRPLDPDDPAGLTADNATPLVTVALDDVSRGSDLLRPDSHVAVYVSYTAPGQGAVTCVLLGDMTIRGVGPAVVGPAGSSTPAPADAAADPAATASATPAGPLPGAAGTAAGVPPGLVTLQVDQQSASKIKTAQSIGGQLSFALLPDAGADASFAEGPDTCRSGDTLFDPIEGIPAS